MEPISPNMLWVPYLTRFNPLNLGLIKKKVRGIKKKTISLNS